MNFAGGTEAVEDRHGDIQDDQVRPELQSLGESFLAIGGFPANLEAARLQDRAHTRPQSFMIVND